MWNSSKKEPEIDAIRREVEYKRRIAEEQGLDRLLLDVYHQSARYFPIWMKSEQEKAYVYPGVTKATERIDKEPAGDTYVTEFSIGAKRYKITSARRGNILARDVYFLLELFLNDQKVFAVSEKHDVRLKDQHYYTLNIEAYVNDDWVEDFRNMREYQLRAEKAFTAGKEEDPELMKRLKKDFNIDSGRIIRIRAWPRYKVYRLFLLLIIFALALFTFLEFKTLAW